MTPTPGTPINFRPLWGLLAVLGGLCAILFFACPFAAKHQVNREVRTQHFARLEQPPILPMTPRRPQPPSRPSPTPAKAAIASMPQSCAICSEPAQRYIKSIQSPFPENRQTYEAPKVVNNPPPAFSYSPAQPSAYAPAYDGFHP